MTATRSSASREPRSFEFQDLPSYTRDEALLASWLARVFPEKPGWVRWLQEAFADFLERPGGLEVRLIQRHSVDAAQPELTHAFTKNEIVLGRDPETDISLPMRSVAGRHARLLLQNGSCILEDLGASLGTYVNKTRLAANTSRLLSSGDRFDIFPYSFEVELRQLWVRDARVDIQAGTATPAAWAGFLESASRDRAPFPVDFFPGGPVCFEAGEFFLEEFAHRLLRPLGIAPARLGLTDTDSGLFELLVTSLLERANRDLPFPFHASPGRLGVRPDLPGTSRGLVLSFTMRVLGITGAFRLFVPCSFLAAAGTPTDASDRGSLRQRVSCAFPVSAGHVDLTAPDMASLEPGDVVLYTAGAELLIPGVPDRGWKVSLEAGNLAGIRIDNYFERPLLPAESSRPDPEETGDITRPDLSALPVRVHVILGEKELTPAEASALDSGSVLAVGLEEAQTVRLAVRGKTIGEGRLVDVEGHPGVRILSWRAAA